MARRRVRGEGAFFQRDPEHHGPWVGRIDLGAAGGKRVRREVTARTKTELAAKMKALKVQVDQGVVPDAGTVEQWMTYWLDQIAAKRVRATTLDTYRMYTARWIIPTLGRRKLRDLKPDHVRALHRAMEDAGLADGSRRQVHAILRRALVVAEREQRILRNPAALVDAPPVGKGHHDSHSPDDASLILANAFDVSDLARLMAALLMALRQGEALGLMWDDVDLTPGGEVVYIHQAASRVKGKGVVVGDVKSTASHRWVPLIPPVAEAFREYRAASGGTGFVFGGEQPASPERDHAIWKAALRRAGVKDAPLHGARSTCASLLDELGVSPRVQADILGHAQVSTTQRHYVHGRAERSRLALEAAGARLLIPRPPLPPGNDG